MQRLMDGLPLQKEERKEHIPIYVREVIKSKAPYKAHVLYDRYPRENAAA